MHFATQLKRNEESLSTKIGWQKLKTNHDFIFFFISLAKVMIREVHLGIRGSPNIVKREKCNRENV